MKRTLKFKDLTTDQLNMIQRCILRVWETIAVDITSLDEGLDNECAIESCLDANFPSMYCGDEGKEVEDIVYNQLSAHDYEKLKKEMMKRCRLL